MTRRDQLLKEGELLHAAGRFGEALQVFRQALDLLPGEPGTFLAIGTCLHDLGRFQEAASAYSEALALAPRFAQAYNNRGNAHLELGRYQESARDYLLALELMPPRPELYTALATALQALGRLVDAKMCCEKALQLDPGCAEAHGNLALLLLLQGDYRQGWREFEWRWRKKGFSSPLRSFSQPLWDGSALSGATLLLHAEQGFGDAIQFARYLPLAAAQGGRVIVECHRELVSLFSRIGGVSAALPFGADLPPFDLHAPFMTLPLLFDTTLETIPGQAPYLGAEPGRFRIWQERLAQFPGLKVGVVWTGSAAHKNDRERSLPFDALTPLWSAPAQFFSMQLGEANRAFAEASAPNLHDLTCHIHDFDDSAAFIAQLDLVVSVDTSVAHLAAALGKPVLLMVARAPDWRWLLQRADSPWYPSLQVFRQPEQGDWAEPVARIAQALRLRSAAPLRLFFYREGRDYLLAGGNSHPLSNPLGQGSAPKSGELSVEQVDSPEAADYILFLPYLNGLLNQVGIEGATRFIEQLPHYRLFAEKHLFFDDHDNFQPFASPALFFRSSVDRLNPGRRSVALPYLGEDLAHWLHFDGGQIRFQTSFVGHAVSSDLRCRLVLAVAKEKRLVSHLEPRQKFHGHLPAGVQDAQRKPFLETISASLTVLCPRGEGLNSIRFFEVMSLGRIPVLISDQVLLPFEEQIDYDAFVIRIAEKDVDRAGELLYDRLQGLDEGQRLAMCRRARQVWEGYFSPARLVQRMLDILCSARSGAPPTCAAGFAGTASIAQVPARHEGRESAHQELRRALQLHGQGMIPEAESSLRRALALCPADLLVTKCLGLFLVETERFAEAAALYRAFLQGAPDTPEMLLCLGEALQALECLDEATGCLLKAVQLAPADADAAYRLGILLHKSNQPDLALCQFLRSDALAPGNPKTLLNVAIAQQSLGLSLEAQSFVEKALAEDPDYPLARWNLAQIQLLRGDYARGFVNYQARFRKPNPVTAKYGRIRRWQGEPLAGRRLLVWAEQAFGDVIQFARYLPLLSRHGGEIHFDCGFDSLLPLIRGMTGVSSVFAGQKEGFQAEFQVPLLSLPAILGTGAENIPAQVPYLEAPWERLVRWQELMRPWGGVRVGVVWAGRREPDPNRSASLSALAPLARVPGVTFFSLQLGAEASELKEAPDGMPIVDLAPLLGDFADSAAAMRQLDLMISIDTASAHLAGALGVPTWVLLPFAPDWRWLLDRDDSPWYPAMTLFRQRRRGDWGEVVGRMLERLQAQAGSMAGRPLP